MKIFRVILFFRASASCSKILHDKKYIFNTVNSGQTLYSGQAQVAQKSCMIKKIFNTVKNFRAHSVFQGKLLKTPECKSILNTVKIFRATLFFRASASCSKILNVKVYSIQWKISGQTLFFRASASCSKSWMVKNRFNTVENFTTNFVFQGMVKKFSIQQVFFKENIWYPVWTCRDPISLILGTRFSLILGTRWYFFLTLRTQFSILGTRIGSLKHLKKTWSVYAATKGNYRKVSCQGEHNTQGTSPTWVNKQGNYRICL